MAMVWKLLVLVAVVLMPFGMSAAMAASASHAPAAAAAQHCNDHGGQPTEKSTKQSADCAIACSMLMVAETRLKDPLSAAHLPPAHPLAESGAGLHPDTATPPPKLS